MTKKGLFSSEWGKKLKKKIEAKKDKERKNSDKEKHKGMKYGKKRTSCD